jgi:hypothetical protein
MPDDKMRTVQLGDLLDENQIKGVLEILNRQDQDDIATTAALKTYLQQFRAELERKGVDDAYLAYLLTYMFQSAPRAR